MLFSRGTYRQSGVCIVLKPSACDVLIESDRISRPSARGPNYVRRLYVRHVAPKPWALVRKEEIQHSCYWY